MDQPSEKKQPSVLRVAGRLHRVVPILDTAGKVIQYAVSPLKVELRKRDLMQILVGSGLLAIPVAFTEETWQLGQTLPLANVILLAVVSVTFIAVYVYFNFYRDLFQGQAFNYLKRVLAVYLISLTVVAMLLTIIQQAPWQQDILLAFKRVIIVGFPASMSAAVSDAID